MNFRGVFIRLNVCGWLTLALLKALLHEIDIVLYVGSFLGIWFLIAALKDE